MTNYEKYVGLDKNKRRDFIAKLFENQPILQMMKLTGLDLDGIMLIDAVLEDLTELAGEVYGT